jgi:tetratricopeptide (TPR) repeat protein
MPKRCPFRVSDSCRDELSQELSMKKPLVVLLLVLAGMASAQSSSQQPGQAAAPSGAAGKPAGSQTKTITNPAEYNSYLNAIQQTDPNGKAVALEGFLQQYPNSVVREDALQLLMATYQQLGNSQKVVESANRLLQANPHNLRALALLAYLKRQQAEAGGPQAQQALADAQQYAQRGLQALQSGSKPEGISDADYQKLKTETGAIFNGVAGFAALQNKNYPQAQQFLSEAVKANPDNLADVYPLALSYLQAQPPDYNNGLWYIARAVHLAAQNPAAQQQISAFGRASYIKYHGNEQGWQQIVQQAAASPVPPAGFAVAPRPTPAQEAAQLVQSKQVKDMSFDEFQLIFTSGNQQAAETVWNQIKDKPIAFQAKVVNVTPTKLTLSATAEDIEKNTADVSVEMVGEIPLRLRPKPGTMTTIQATPVSYTPQPFMITMTKGTLVATPKAAPSGRTTRSRSNR